MTAKHETVRPATDGQLREVDATLLQARPTSLTFNDAQHIAGHKGAFIVAIQAVFTRFCPGARIQQLHVEWQKFYSQFFGIDCDFSSLHIPEQREGFDRLIVVAQGISAQRVYDVCKEQFNCYKYTNDSLGKAVPTNERTSSNGAYAIWVRDRVEADEELKSAPAEQIEERKLATETLCERLIHELKHFSETQQHLDLQNITLCAGSRYSDGRVPSVHWLGGRLCVSWDDPDDAYDHLRAREAVS